MARTVSSGCLTAETGSCGIYGELSVTEVSLLPSVPFHQCPFLLFHSPTAEAIKC